MRSFNDCFRTNKLAGIICSSCVGHADTAVLAAAICVATTFPLVNCTSAVNAACKFPLLRERSCTERSFLCIIGLWRCSSSPSGEPYSARSLAVKFGVNYRSALGMLRKIRRVIRSENGPHPLAHAGRLLCENGNTATIYASERPAEAAEATKEATAAPADATTATKEAAPAEATTATKEAAAAQAEATITTKEAAAAPTEAAAAQSYATLRVYKKPHEVVERAKHMMLEKAKTFIKRVYRNVKRDFIQEYIDEYYYRRTGYCGMKRFLDMLYTSSLVLPMPSLRS